MRAAPLPVDAPAATRTNWAGNYTYSTDRLEQAATIEDVRRTVSAAEIQTEYFVPRARAYQAILAVEELRDQITPHLLVTELPAIAADDLWMSRCYKRDSLALHFTWEEWKPSTLGPAARAARSQHCCGSGLPTSS